MSLERVADAIASITGPGETGPETTLVHAPPEAAPVRRIGLALDVDSALVSWVRDRDPGLVVAHRYWGWDRVAWPPEVGLLGCHDAFDRRFGFGDNPELRALLGVRTVAVLASRGGHPLGTVASGTPRTVHRWRGALSAVFGGIERELPAAAGRREDENATVDRVAIARAMTPALVEEAAGHGARLYITGQARTPALAIAATLGIDVIAIGHRRSERWMLGVLASLLAADLPGCAIEVAA